ncbi:hypothetical protein [Rummeliibacillus pycnus]|uniref:hypothetical protein n=1 Tax=Rummeliibacillus pycnus TaxID=101070 RepID=UPI000C9A3163|nr:hypothetical protein [Rummeliibacillus pycnus]
MKSNESINIKDKVFIRTIDLLDKDTRILKDIQYNHCDLKNMDIKDRTFYELTSQFHFHSVIAYCNVLNIDSDKYLKTVNLPLFYENIFTEFELKDTEVFYNERIQNDKFYIDRELHKKEGYFYKIICELIKK